MMRSRSLKWVSVLGIAMGAASPALAVELYAVEVGAANVNTIDLTTGVVTLVNPVPLTDVAGIAWDPLGTIYARESAFN